MTAEGDRRDAKPWGRAATLGLGFIAMLVGQLAALLALTWWYGLGFAQLPDFSGDGAAVSIIILISTPVQILLLVLMARQTGAGAADYLGFVLPRRSEAVIGLLAVALFIVAGNSLSWLLGQNIVTPFQHDIYQTASEQGWLVWLWLAVVVASPLGEELLFRGFLFRGWHRGPHDAWAAIGATALLWAVIHVQYDLYVIGQILVCGVMLGWFRWATGSTVLVMLMHAAINAEGMLETVISLSR